MQVDSIPFGMDLVQYLTRPPAEYFKVSESAAVLSSCYVSDSLMNYVLYTLHTNPVPTSPGSGDSTLAGMSSAPGTLPGGHTIIHALLMLYKSCSLFFGCCDADPSIHVSLWPLHAWWMAAFPWACPGKANTSTSPSADMGNADRQSCLPWPQHHIPPKVRALLAFRQIQLCPHGCRSLQLNAENRMRTQGFP